LKNRHDSSDQYFVTTASFTGASRLWRLRFGDLTNPAAGGTLDMLLTGGEGHKMLDNIAVDRSGHILLQEDVGNNAHLGKLWRYDIANGTLTQIAQHDPQRFMSGAPAFLTQDEESSGVIDMAGILGPGWYLLDVQAHYATDAETVEGGQLLAVYDPTWLDASSQKVEYAVIGDTPYGSAQIADFPNLISAINAAPNIGRVVHVGDIKNGSSRCDDAYFAQIFSALQGFADPLVYTPGDNEWTDCHRANNGGYDPLERLGAIRSLFFPNPGRTLGGAKKDVLTQSDISELATFVENTLWSEAQVGHLRRRARGGQQQQPGALVHGQRGDQGGRSGPPGGGGAGARRRQFELARPYVCSRHQAGLEGRGAFPAGGHVGSRHLHREPVRRLHQHRSPDRGPDARVRRTGAADQRRLARVHRGQPACGG